MFTKGVYALRPDSGADYGSVRSLARGLELLRVLNRHEKGRASLAQLAAGTGLHRTTVRRLLETLIGETGAERVVYAGDDVTDLEAIELAAARGRGFFVRSSERDVTFGEDVEIVDSTEALLERMKQEVLSIARQS